MIIRFELLLPLYAKSFMLTFDSGKMGAVAKMAGVSIREGENGIETPNWSKYLPALKSRPHQHLQSTPTQNPHRLLTLPPNLRMNMQRVSEALTARRA